MHDPRAMTILSGLFKLETVYVDPMTVAVKIISITFAMVPALLNDRP
jgi:hypothetical protein